MMTRLALAMFGSLSLAAATHAQPLTRGETIAVDVPYGDLDLSRRPGADVMVARIRAAATAVCGGTPDNVDIITVRLFRVCVDAATRNAMSDLRSAVGSRFYSEDGNAPRTIAVTRR